MADRNGNYGYPALTCLRSLSSHETPRSPAARAGSSGGSPSGRVVVTPRADRPRVVHVAALPGWITLGGFRHDHALPPRAMPGDDPCADAALAPGTLRMDPHEWMTRRQPALTPARAPAAGDSISIAASHRPHRMSVRYPRLDTPSAMRHAEGKRAAMSTQPSLALTSIEVRRSKSRSRYFLGDAPAFGGAVPDGICRRGVVARRRTHRYQTLTRSLPWTGLPSIMQS
jgi:hypothetical protein